MTDNFITFSGRELKALASTSKYGEICFYDSYLYVINPVFTVRIHRNDFDNFAGKNFQVDISDAKKLKVSDIVVISDDATWQNLSDKSEHVTQNKEVNEKTITSMKSYFDSEAMPFDGVNWFGFAINTLEYLGKLVSGFKIENNFVFELIHKYAKPDNYILRAGNKFWSKSSGLLDVKEYYMKIIFTTANKS